MALEKRDGVLRLGEYGLEKPIVGVGGGYQMVRGGFHGRMDSFSRAEWQGEDRKEILMTEKTMIEMMKMEWADIHHSRIQEWSALGAVAGAQIAVTQSPKLLKETEVTLLPTATAVVGCLIGIAFAIIGVLITCRHRQLMQMKLGWIFKLEERLGLVITAENPAGIIPKEIEMPSTKGWCGLSRPRWRSTSGLILSLYTLFFLFDLACLVLLLMRK